MTSDPIIDKIDEHFGVKLAEVIKAYVQELVNHELDVITYSDWFSEKIEIVYESVDEMYKVRDSKNVWFIYALPSICIR